MRLEQRLGFGKDGIVWASSVATAIKGYVRADIFARELQCYQRLGQHEVQEILGHRVPALLDWSDEQWVIEMTIVKPPFLLDFASAYLDDPPDFSPEVIEEWRQEKIEQFSSHWPTVEAALELLQTRFGIYLLDVHPGNMTFIETPE